MQDNSDIALISNASKGDIRAFRTLVERYQPMAFSVTYKFLNDHHDSEEVVQEAFFRVWKNLKNYKSSVKFSTWLYKIVSNLCLDVLKSRSYRDKLKSRSIDNLNLSGQSQSPLDQLESHEMLDIIHLAVETLTPKQKAVFVLRDLEGLSGKEVSVALNLNEGAVKSNLYYARLRLGEIIREHYGE